MIQSNNPLKAAQELHAMIGWTQPSDLTLEDIAGALGILVKDEPIKGSDGRILIKGDTAIITVNNTITNPGRRNFILGHEIGHFLLHKDATALFSDTPLTLSEWFKKGIHEKQANDFATELLMPAPLYVNKVEGKKLSINLIEDVSAYFQTSLLATFLRYISLGSFPVMVIYMEKGVVKWKFHSNDFPFTYLPINSNVPAWTVAGDYFTKGQLEPNPEKVDAIEWFAEDFEIKKKKDWKLWEQCYQVGESGLVSVLWTY
ncbi:ImmA/IrrE family metallo-endopeptidase [Pedobacter sp. MR22-3]|uniref:ImmA/IrrE family metallo-endopeptidase n=1 Tax=Pedobacter sp. MR22-3 TaxID=2994552 RepID=UPI00224663CD|nr:ImmA/IrrE family metallo-endopeptidase [Pedobacter sp. MR22-3]MCX2586469.1 ImmA/IrrE family metallo-endopeptidase [Pedobacter sp. MR22-3]